MGSVTEYERIYREFVPEGDVILICTQKPEQVSQARVVEMESSDEEGDNNDIENAMDTDEDMVVEDTGPPQIRHAGFVEASYSCLFCFQSYVIE